MPAVIRSIVLGCLICLLPVSSLQAGTVVTDAAERKVTVPDRVQRLVTTFKPATLSAICLGLAETLVGVDTSSKQDSLNLAVYPDVAHLAGVGSKSRGINLETVIGLKPDLVVLYSQKSGVHLANRLQESGIPAMVIKPETFTSIRRTLHLLAAACDRPKQADRVIQAMDRVQELVHTRVHTLSPSDRKRVYYAGPIGFYSTAPSGMLQDLMIHKAGGVNVASHLRGYFKRISAEQLLAWTPESIVVCRMIRSQARNMLARPELGQLPAVEKGQVHVFPSNLAPWDFPSPLSALGVLWLGTRLYPERFADLSLPQEVNTFHHTLFGQSFDRMQGQLDDDLFGLQPAHAHSQEPGSGDTRQ